MTGSRTQIRHGVSDLCVEAITARVRDRNERCNGGTALDGRVPLIRNAGNEKPKDGSVLLGGGNGTSFEPQQALGQRKRIKVSKHVFDLV